MLAVRKVEEADRELLDEAAEADSFHRAAGLTGSHWANGNTLMYSDDQGLVVALRTSNVARVDVQFLTPDARRNAKALVEGFWLYIGVLRMRGIDEVIFNSNSAAVVHFFEKRFKFRHLGGNTYSLYIKAVSNGRPSDTEVNLMHEQATQVQQEIQQQSTQFAESQSLYATLAPQLEQMMANPTGFSAQELADLNATNVNVTGAQYANAQKQTNLVNSSENMAGLTSGVAAGEGAALRNAAAGQVASNATNIQLQNAQLQNQNRNTATSELLALQSGQGQMAIGIGNTENNAENNAFNQANTVNQQQDALTNSLIGAGLGIGMTALTGGISGMLTGGTFGSGAGNSLSGGQGGF